MILTITYRCLKANCDLQPHKKLLLFTNSFSWLFHQLIKILPSCRSYTALVASSQTLLLNDTLAKLRKDPSMSYLKTPTPDGVAEPTGSTCSLKGSMNEYVEWLLNREEWWSL